ncbi:MAG: hypothetical protein KIS90_00015 [Phenylobacterium sp.]|nr:hypothetical protein [Phenylobacterium sp.]
MTETLLPRPGEAAAAAAEEMVRARAVAWAWSRWRSRARRLAREGRDVSPVAIGLPRRAGPLRAGLPRAPVCGSLAQG